MRNQLADRPSGAAQAVIEARHHDPFQVLGLHQLDETYVRVCAFLPHAREVALKLHRRVDPMLRVADLPLFEWVGNRKAVPQHYQLIQSDFQGRETRFIDPYSFAPTISDYDLHLFGEGQHWQIYNVLGAKCLSVDGVTGVRFATWAPGAERVSVIGDFNGWDDRRHCMRNRGGSGVWELFIPGLESGSLYKYAIRSRHTGLVQEKSDPYAREFEVRPASASRVVPPNTFRWQDAEWLENRRQWRWQESPLAIYEVHLGSWRRRWDNSWLSYGELAHQLVDYVTELGFTHIELLPITEHPLDESWGYQSTGYFAPTSRYGTPDDFRYFVDYCHQNGIGVIMDWVPGHFPKDYHALARFDGTALYEHEDPRLGEHREWGTLIYNYGRNEVRNFLIGSALYWLESFHIDGLRVDAVASMLYLNYSRRDGDWIPNMYGGNQNLEAISFLKALNDTCMSRYPGTLVIAEESTSWPQVSRPSWLGGLGFSIKWNMGWMHDTLKYLSHDPVHRQYHHDMLTFGLLYAFTENFMLPLSHDEVVHGKGSLINRMPGDDWQKRANMRLLYAYQYTYPGSKLLFMGGEFGQPQEWDESGELNWSLLDQPGHKGIQFFVGDLNRLYRSEPALFKHSYQEEGFAWIDCHDAPQSVISYQRTSGKDLIIVVLNFTPVPRTDYRIGVPFLGTYTERLNSDSAYYGGSNLGNPYALQAEPIEWMGHRQSLVLTLPPLGALVLKHRPTVN